MEIATQSAQVIVGITGLGGGEVGLEPVTRILRRKLLYNAFPLC